MFLSFLEVINKETMQNDYQQQQQQRSEPPNTDLIHFDDENISLSNRTINTDDEKVEEKEHSSDEKHTEIGVDIDNKNDKPLIQVAMTDESSTYENFYYHQPPQQNQHTNSHDSLLQPDYHLGDHINTTASSTDDLSTTHQLSSSVFHSKDSALGLSDDNLNLPQTNQFIVIDDDEDDDDQQRLPIQDDQSKFFFFSSSD